MTRNRSNKNKKSQIRKVNFWQMMRDVLIASLSKGQFVIAVIFFTWIIMILKMPSKDVSRLVFEIINGLKTGNLIPTFLIPVILLSWFFHSRWQRKIIRTEMERVSETRSEVQKRILGDSLTSSSN